MKNIHSDLKIILIWLIGMSVFIISPLDGFFRTIFGIPFILFIPGYILVAALFPKKNDLGPIERMALSFGVSIAVIPLIGILLNFTFGIRLIPIFVILCTYTIILTFITEYRRMKLPDDERFTIQFHKIYDIINNEKSTPRNILDKVLTAILIIMSILAVGMIYYVISMPKTEERFTEFYIINQSGGTYNYSVKLHSPTNMTVGVVNHEYEHVNYTVKIVIDKDILASKELSLNHSDKWEKNVTLLLNTEYGNMKLEFLLFKENNLTSPYRDLHLWVEDNT